MPFTSYRRRFDPPPARVARPRFTSHFRAPPELPEPVLMIGAVTFRDRDGIWWTVREQRPEAPDCQRALIFASAGRLHHVSAYPEAWRSLSTAALIVLGTGA